MIILLLLSVSLVFLDLPSVLSLAEGENCVTPNNEWAICKRLTECPAIESTITKSSSAEQIMFAQKSFCGHTTDNKVMVCCGNAALRILPLPVYQHRLLPKPETCGLQSPDNKIANGKETGIQEFPWMALLYYLEEGESVPVYACGGTLINDRYVLTAAHCIRAPYNRKLISVRLGEHNIATDRDCDNGIGKYRICNPAARDYEIQTSIIHEGYVNKFKLNDIGLLRLNRKVEFAEHIQPICLPIQSSPHPVGTNVTAAGWGDTELGSKSGVKLKATLVVITQSECATTLFFSIPDPPITEKQYCAKGICQNGRKCTDTCYGDSGGPSVRTISDTTQWVQEGITSYGVNICGEKFPAVYTRVSQYADWIGNKLED